MAFDFPSVATEKKLAKKKTKEAKEKKQQEDISKAVSPVSNKKGLKGEIASEQLDAAFSSDNIGDGGKFIKKDKSIDLKKVKKIVKAAADDKQLERTERSLMRHRYSVGGKAIRGGRAKLKGGGMATRGLGRAFMKGGKV